jgi:dihydrolipoamide dehydrogenase
MTSSGSTMRRPASSWSGAARSASSSRSFYHDIGTQVTLLEYLPAIVPLEDREVSQLVERSFTKRGILVMTNARFDPATVKVDKKRVRLRVGPEGKPTEEVAAEALLVGGRAGRERRGHRA